MSYQTHAYRTQYQYKYLEALLVDIQLYIYSGNLILYMSFTWDICYLFCAICIIRYVLIHIVSISIELYTSYTHISYGGLRCTFCYNIQYGNAVVLSVHNKYSVVACGSLLQWRCISDVWAMSRDRVNSVRSTEVFRIVHGGIVQFGIFVQYLWDDICRISA